MPGYVIKVSIMHASSPVWRRIVIPAGITFQDLNDILQTSFGWSYDHLHQFYFPTKKIYVEPVDLIEESFGMDEEMDEADALVDDAFEIVKSFQYRYDLGDCWDHKVTFEKEEPDYNLRYAQIIKYKGDNFEEDSGGIWNDIHREFSLEDANDDLREQQFSDISSINDHELREKLSVKESMKDMRNHWSRFYWRWRDGKALSKSITELQLVRGRSTQSMHDLARGRDGLSLLMLVDESLGDGMSQKQMRDLYITKVLQDPMALINEMGVLEATMNALANAEEGHPLDKGKDYYRIVSEGMQACILNVSYEITGSCKTAVISFAADFLEAWKRNC